MTAAGGRSNSDDVMVEKTKSPTAAGNSAPPPMAPKPPADAAGKSAARVPAAPATQPPPAKRGGRPRKDGLPPGSPEAEAADKKNDSERHKLARETAAQVAEPAALPSALAPGAGPGAAPAPGGGPLAPGEDAPPVPWQPETLTGLVDDLLEAAEESRVASYLAKCQEAGLTGKLVKEIESDARFPRVAKALLKNAIPRLAAKWLNRSGISAEYQEEISVLTAVILIVKHDAGTAARLEKLIEAAKKAKVVPLLPSRPDMTTRKISP